VIEDEGLVERSAVLGAHLLGRLRAVQSQLPAPLIREVRGLGLWAGVDLDPHWVRARAVVERMVERGVLSKETHDTVIRFAPPLVISREALDWSIDVFADVMREFAARALSSRSAATAERVSPEMR
jgi:ornithine--oxo-acid transaminase